MSEENCYNRLTSSDEMELRSVVKFCVGLKLSPTETLKKIQESDTLPTCGKTFVFKWHGRFKRGRTSVYDDGRPGRPTSSVSPRNTARVEQLIRGDRRLTVRDIAEELSLTKYAVYQILTEELHMSKVSARWVPRLLRDTDKQRRVECSQSFIQRYESDGDDFLDRIVTTDETWLHYYDPESKQQSSVWKTPNTPPPKKARAQRSCQKDMYIYFMDRRGVILQHRVRQGCTVNAAYYSKVLRIHLVQALLRKRPDLRPEDVILHQDNAPAHRAHATELDIALVGFELLPHPPYSPDLAPMDFRLFPDLKAQLRGKRFETSAELKNSATRVLRSFDSEWFKATFNQWVRRHRKCVITGGDYVEKVNRALQFDN